MWFYILVLGLAALYLFWSRRHSGPSLFSPSGKLPLLGHLAPFAAPKTMHHALSKLAEEARSKTGSGDFEVQVLGQRMVIIAEAETMQRFLKHPRDAGPLFEAAAASVGAPKSLPNSFGQRHSKLRRLQTPALSKLSVRRFIPDLIPLVDRMMGQLKTEVETHSGRVSATALTGLALEFTLSVIFRIAFGVDINEVSASDKYAFERIFPVFGDRVVALIPLHKWNIFIGAEKTNQETVVKPAQRLILQSIASTREAINRGEAPNTILASLIVATDDDGDLMDQRNSPLFFFSFYP
jgi:cytochrome P450